MGVSGVPETVAGVNIGFTDFSEFSVGAGIPSGVTAYGDGNPSPSTNAIANDPVEGNYFSMFNQGFNSWGFGYDAFDGIMGLAGGELLARVWIDIPVNGRKLLGPAANMVGATGPTFDNWNGAAHRLDPDENSGVFSTGGGSSSNTVLVNLPGGFQDDNWAWVRVRRVQNGTNPGTEDDFFVTIWFGDIDDEPVSVDGSNIGQARSVAWAADAIGWAMPGNAGAENQQRIAFLSFSVDPDIVPPPFPFVAPAGTSGVPQNVAGCDFGFTDFSEFAVQGTLPAGITAFGISSDSPTTEEIRNDPNEGNYFFMDGHIVQSWGYGYDAFDALLSGGELLARVWVSFALVNRRNIGPAINLSGLIGQPEIGPDFDGEGGGIYLRAGVDIESAGVVNNDGSGSVPVNSANFQEAFQNGAWAWQRVRITEIGGGFLAWEIKSWYGSIGQEPAALDGSNPSQSRIITGAVPGALGWMMTQFGDLNEQRIAYLSFTSNPVSCPPQPPALPVAPSGTSGVPEQKFGVDIGFTDFSEFSVGAGLPAGITEYGIGTGSPTGVAITNDDVEGHYFEMTGMVVAQPVLYGFGIDAFDAIIEFGEILARIYLNINIDETWGGGPCFKLTGKVGEPSPDMKAAGSTIRRDDADPEWNSQGNSTQTGTVFVNVNNRFMQEPSINGTWLWMRVRNVANIAVPAQDDWEVTAWHGSIEDEPAVVDGSSTTVTPNARGFGAIGWWELFASTAEQRIAYLSFSSDPLLVPPPIPIIPPTAIDAISPRRVSDLWFSGALRDKSPSGLIQTRNTKAAGWSFQMTWPLLSVRNFAHQKLMTFLYKAWNRGEIFPAKHPLQPGSGLRPNGVGTIGVEVNTAVAAIRDVSILTDGWPASTSNVACAGDAIKIEGDEGVYILTETTSSDSAGGAELFITPPLRIAPADNAKVKTTNVTFRVVIAERSRLEQSRNPQSLHGPSVTLMEALN